MELVFFHLDKHYGKVHALKDVNFSLTTGVHGLLGPNGAGKSTLMNILSGNLEQTAGLITYDGKDIRTMGKAFRRLLGYMPQQQALYPGMTAFRFLSYMAALRAMTKEAAQKAIPRVLEQVGLTEKAGERIKTFSGGMKQRLLIAQAILHDPKILILDEPTAGLDPKQRIAVRNLIAELAEDKIVILSTHVVGDVSCISKEILLLKEGRLLCQASPGELVRQLEGSVWEVISTKEDLSIWQKQYQISNIATHAQGLCIRILSDTPVSGGQIVSPTLEDVYLRCFGEEGSHGFL